MKIKEVLSHLEHRFPLDYQEDFDNCGVQCGDVQREITGVLVCFDMSDETIDEAIALNANLVISHHPLMLKKGIRKIEPTNRVGRILCKALEHKMVLYSMHTNLDSAPGGVNDLFAQKLGLQNVSVLSPLDGGLCKIAFFVPPPQYGHYRPHGTAPAPSLLNRLRHYCQVSDDACRYPYRYRPVLHSDTVYSYPRFQWFHR